MPGIDIGRVCTIDCPAHSLSRLSALTALRVLKLPALTTCTRPRWGQYACSMQGGVCYDAQRRAGGSGSKHAAAAQRAAWNSVFANLRQLRHVDLLVNDETALPPLLHSLRCETLRVVAMQSMAAVSSSGKPDLRSMESLAAALAPFPAVRLQFKHKFWSDAELFPLMTLPNVVEVKAYTTGGSPRWRVWRPRDQPWSPAVCPCWTCRRDMPTDDQVSACGTMPAMLHAPAGLMPAMLHAAAAQCALLAQQAWGRPSPAWPPGGP